MAMYWGTSEWSAAQINKAIISFFIKYIVNS